MNAVVNAPRAVRRRVLVGPAPRIAVDVTGHGPLVLCLHGIGGNRRMWSGQVDALATEFTVATWDARGYGDSDDYPGTLDFADFSSDLLRVVEQLGVRRAHLVGQSMGGRIALDFYARHAGRVATLTLADTSAGSARAASAEEVERFLRLRKAPLLAGLEPRDIAPQVAQTLVGPGTDPEVLERVVAMLGELHRDSYLKTLDTVTRYSAFPAFESIAVPTLVVVGEHDTIATPAYARDMAGRIAGARFVEIAGGSHVSNMDRPADFNRAVLDFLRAHATAADTPAPAAGTT